MQGSVEDIKELSQEDSDFRRVLYTGHESRILLPICYQQNGFRQKMTEASRMKRNGNLMKYI